MSNSIERNDIKRNNIEHNNIKRNNIKRNDIELNNIEPNNIELSIDGRTVSVPEGTSVWEAAREADIAIPTLCHQPELRPVGVCRMCVVEVEGERTLTASCARRAEAGMVVRSGGERVQRARGMLRELLLSEQGPVSPRDATTDDDELRALPAGAPLPARLPEGRGRGEDGSSPVIQVDHQACILCDRCIRACSEIQHHDVIGRSGKGYGTRIAFDLDRPMGPSSCVSCGECVATCPTGALVSKPIRVPLRPRAQLESVDSVCPWCGVGCALTYHVDRAANEIVFAEGRESPGSQGRLCVKGRYGFDYASHAHRLTRPLVRVDYPKGPLSSAVQSSERQPRKPGGIVDYDEVMPAFREASWDEALELVARRLLEIREAHGPGALAGFGSAKCSNEEAYLFQKLVRAALGTNNVDHCTRLCHASSVSALLEMIGSGAVTTTYGDVENADFILLTGSNATANHPVAATFFKQAVSRGAQLVVVDPRRSKLADEAWRFCEIRPGSDVAFYNALMHVIIEEDLVDHDYIGRFTENFEEVAQTAARYSPRVASAICGIPEETLREVALAYGRAKSAITFWGMGMSQHVHGTDNCRSIISLCLMTGNVGRPGTGLHPLRGQNNVQGASDAGLVPMVYPDYQPVGSEEVRRKFEDAWGVELDPEPGLTVVEIMKGAGAGRIKGMYMLGENPFLSDPNINEVRKALTKLDFLVVQDIFLTETAEFADVILPATSALEKEGSFTNTDRRVQLGRAALAPPGEARLDWEILCDLSTRMGYPMRYDSPAQVFDEFVSLTHTYRGLSHEKLGPTGKLYPCPDPEHSDGTVVMFSEGFPTPSGRARFRAADHTGADELPDGEYPLILLTGRLLEHWHTGVMSRRSQALSRIEPEPFVEVHPEDCRELGLTDGAWATVSSRRGRISLKVRESRAMQPGSVFIPFHFREAAANFLTTDRLDPDGKIPEFKYCAVRLAAAG
ncbi:MAG: formate dehydrogenase subunit alpha [Deltaproteobacteria bacterium]|nr:formate dehydrogenase subunit alpha [Deltaproteobacteria bacterium]MBW2417683.1 formate dehydrogenase subunit alpha [Deltaproteobacteria bacterium]